MINRDFPSDGEILQVLAEYKEYLKRTNRSYGPYTVEEERAAGPPISAEDKIQRLPGGVELGQDGSKTALIIHEALRREVARRLKDEGDDAASALIRELGPALGDALKRLSKHRNGAERKQLRHLTSEKNWQENFKEYPLAQWLLNQRIPLIRNRDGSGEVGPGTGGIVTFADQIAPFFVVLQPEANAHASDVLSLQTVYRSEIGLESIPVNSIPLKPPYWDEERLQLTSRNVYVLIVDGVLRGQMWSERLAEFMKTKRGGGSFPGKPILVVLADNFEKPGGDGDGDSASNIDSGQDFHVLVLPAPFDYKVGEDSGAVERPVLNYMATTFGTEVVKSWGYPGQEGIQAAPAITPERLGRARWVAIDRQRTLLSPLTEITRAPRSFLGGWTVRPLNVFTLCKKTAGESLVDAEALVRWRIELEHGFVAGAGAALYRVGTHLCQSDSWVWQAAGQAMQEPLRTLLDRAVQDLEDLDRQQRVVQEVLDWVMQASRHTFRLTSEEKEEKVQEIDRALQQNLKAIELEPRAIILGDGHQLGIVTPLPEIWRIINRVAEGTIDWRFRQMSRLDVGV